MEGLRLCLTGFDAPAKQELERALATVPQLRLQRNFNAAVTHLIASRAGTPKYLAAVQLGVPVVTREWAVQLAQTGAPPPVELHSVKPLSGLVVCVTGLKGDARARIERLCSEHGGRYSPNLDRECTHLLALPSMAFEKGSIDNLKVRAAVRWGIPVLSHHWLDQQVASAGCAKEADFSLDTAVLGRLIHCDNVPIRDQPPPLSCFELPPDDVDDWPLEGCCFYLAGFKGDAEGERRAVNIILRCGGLCVPFYVDDVTHVIVHDAAAPEARPELIFLLTTHPSQFVLRPAWLYQCWNTKRLCPEAPYFRFRAPRQQYSSIATTAVPDPGEAAAAAPAAGQSHRVAAAPPPAAGRGGYPNAAQTGGDADPEDVRIGPQLGTAAPAAKVTAGAPQPGTGGSSAAHVDREGSPLQDKQVQHRMPQPDSSDVLQGLQFLISPNFYDEHLDKVQQFLAQHSATLLRNAAEGRPQYLVCPHNDQMTVPAAEAVPPGVVCVTMDWLGDCARLGRPPP
eukprot:EG_transcript_8830